MKYRSFAEVYADNDRIRERLIATVGALDDKATEKRLDEGGWSVGQIVEHISAVDEGICKICSKLLAAARDKNLPGDGSVRLSPEFTERIDSLTKTKLEAPERVHPTGEQSVAQSLERLSANRERLSGIQHLFEAFDSTEDKFPHPHFGGLSAAEWLVLLGAHEERHLGQIDRIVANA
ncbi:MAG TPA: DinB family protein [Pyrinomonadaceae bacterium]|jgi:uncharacterized damage-inducible protein DinB|nr:DinB family protein [Pyrinomonadaceae bacterium]